MREARIWVVIADGETARISSSFDGTTILVPAPSCANPFAGADDQASRSRRAWHGSESRPCIFYRGPKQEFAAHIAQILLEAAREHAYDGLIVIAAPEIEAELRRAIGPEASAKLVGDIIRNHPYPQFPAPSHTEQIRH
jgi:protein required for attachment to host cells